MIVSKLAQDKNIFDKVDELFFKELDIKIHSNKLDIVYVIMENNNLLGACLISLDSKIAYLDSIFIKKEFRKMRIGDGLLRASLNYVIRKGINKIYCSEKSDFLNREGFFNTNEENICDIDEFFNTSSCGDK